MGRADESTTSWVQRMDGRVRRRPVVALIGLVLAPVIYLTSATGAVASVYEFVRDVIAPNRAELSALTELDLGMRLAAFEDTFGVAKQVVDLCAEGQCPDDAPESLQMYIHETDDLTVRAVFAGDRLDLYAVTLAGSDVTPPIRWLGFEMGELGRVTFSEAWSKTEGVSPTAHDLFFGAKAISYAEVASVGAPGKYRGLLLGWAPEGYAGPEVPFDSSAAMAVQQQALDGIEDGGPTLERFRSNSAPNTWGEFRDDGGYVSRLARNAEDVRVLLHVGTEL